MGNRLSQTTTGTGAPGTPTAPGTVSYGYDDRDRITAEGSQVYGWDDNGNLTSKTAEATYTWDFENRLTRVQKTDGTVVAHTYDADGVRVQTSTTLPGETTLVTDYLVDTSASLSHVVAETDGAGALKAYYVRGDDLLAVMRPDVGGPGGWQSRFFHADHIGSIRRLTDEAGNVTDGYDTTAFGELIAHTGTDPQPYLFAGEPYDPNVGFQYHRARWMDPRTGILPGMDPWGGAPRDPSTLHRYLYASGEPTRKTDPTGRLSAMESVSVGAIVGALASISLVSYQAAMFSMRFPADGFSQPPTGYVFGVQTSFSPGEFLARRTSNPLLIGLGLGLYFVGGQFGLEIAIPRNRPNTAWVFAYPGISVGIGNSPTGGMAKAGYAGLFWRAESPTDYLGTSFCSAMGAGSIMAGAPGSGSGCVSKNAPHAYTFTVGVGTQSQAAPILQTSQAYYAFLGEFPVDLGLGTGADQVAFSVMEEAWNTLAVLLFGDE